MKLVFFNDTNRDLSIHAASILPVGAVAGYSSPILPASDAVFTVPDGEDVFVKVWNNTLLVR